MSQIILESTPNPSACKFVLATCVKKHGRISYTNSVDCDHIPLACSLLEINDVKQVHFFDNIITITQTGDQDWCNLRNQIEQVIELCIDQHDPDFIDTKSSIFKNLTPELQKIDKILDLHIRPCLQADGGDIRLLELRDNILSIYYEGACGNCPSSMQGTLQTIESIIRSEYHPNIRIAVLNDENF